MPQFKALEFDWTPIHSWSDGNPFTIAFCYPMEGKPFVLKGGCKSIEPILKKTKVPVVVHFSYWHHGNSRYLVNCYGFPKNVLIYFWTSAHKVMPMRGKTRRYIRLSVNVQNGKSVDYRMRRIPRCFPEQLREFAKE
jgi:hypothetical protein